MVAEANVRKTRKTEATKQAIFHAAVRHFAKFGYEGAHVRQMLKEANANASLAHYYFGSKEKLYHAVVDHFLEPVLAKRREYLSNWKHEKGSKADRTAKLFVAYVRPHLEYMAREDGVYYSLLMQRLLATPVKQRVINFDDVLEVRSDYKKEFRKIHQGINDGDLEFIFNSLVYIMLSVQDEDIEEAKVDISERIATLVSGGIKSFT